MGKKFRDFESTRRFVQSLHLKSVKEWQSYSKTHRSKNIPSFPYRTYKEEGWVSWGDFLGTGNVAPQLKKFRDFENARRFVQSLHLKNCDEWRQYCKSGKKPQDIPIMPQRIYKNKGWKNMKNWLNK